VEYADLDAALQAARGGDEWAITYLFRAVHPGLLHYARRHAPYVADDLVAETWLAAAKGFATFEGDADHFRAWLFVIARRQIANHYRTRGRRPDLVALTDQAPPSAAADELAIETLSIDTAIEALVQELSADQAEVVLLRVVADLSEDEVAQIMGRSPGSVRVLQHRALRRLAKIWDRGVVTR